MANNNLPAHDFAPPWLKIPTYDTTNNTHPDGIHGNHKEEHRTALNRRLAGGLRPGYHGYRDRDGPHLQPQAMPLGERSPLFLSRHQSLDAEEPLLLPQTSHQTCPQDKALPRRPHSRHDFRDFVQPSFPKMSPGSNSVDSCAHLPAAILGPVGKKKNLGGANNFNQEFPTLLGGDEVPAQQPIVTNGSVWENPRNSKVHGTVLKKVHLIQKPLRSDPASLDAQSKSPSSAGTPNVVSGGPLSPKPSRHAGVPTPPVSKAVCSSQSSLYRALLPPAKKAPPAGPHTMEVLVKHPKVKGNKGDFLKALRSNDHPRDHHGAKGGAGDSPLLVHQGCIDGNGHPEEEMEEEEGGDRSGGELALTSDIKKLALGEGTNEGTPLSSSLEAEQRLLREMGWKEEASDDDAYAPLTEDELREFQYLTKMRQEKQRNGVQRPMLPSSLQEKGLLCSPRRVAIAQPFTAAPVVVLPTDNGWSSSSDTDSDGV